MNVTFAQLTRLSRWEIFQFLFEVLEFSEARTQEMPDNLINQLENLRTSFDIYDIEIAQERRISAEELLKADEERDFAVRKFYTLVRDYSDYRYDTKKMEAASALKQIFKRYGTGSAISRKNQDPQTSIITNLLQELARPDATQCIATLDLTDVVEALTESNKIFAHEQRVRDNVKARYVKGVAFKARKNVQNDFLAFTNMVNALAIVEDEEKYVELKLFVNQLLKDYVGKARQRKRKKTEKEQISDEATTP